MHRTTHICIAAFTVFLVVGLFLECENEKNPSEQPKDEDNGLVGLPDNYKGILVLNYVNTAFPEFDESVDMTVDLKKNGEVSIGSGTLNYDAQQGDSDFRIQRTGNLSTAPGGYIFEDLGSGEKVLIVNEGINYYDHMITWYYDRQAATWKKALDQENSGTWNNDLIFYIVKATIEPEVVERVEATGKVRWTLTLEPKIP